jgi:hypothetical protein
VSSIAFSIIAVVVAALASALWSGVENYLKQSRRTQGETIEDRVARLTQSLEEATGLIANIESEIKARSSLATQLQDDLDRYNNLITIKKPEVEAIAQLLRGELKKEGRSTFWKGFLINFLFFILGAGASIVISKLLR